MSVIGSINVMVGANTSGLTKGLGKAESEIGGFGSSITGLVSQGAALAGGFFGLTKAFDLFSGGIKGAADMEQAEISFGVLFKSADTAKAVLGDLSKFAAETPFELPELTGAARSLAAFGVDAGSITTTLRMLGDVASGINQPIGDIAEIFGKAKVQGRLFAEDINQLTGRGIPVIAELAKQFGVTDDKVKKLVENGKVGFPEIQKAFQAMTADGGTFNGMMAMQSQSLSGLWSTLQDGIGGALRDLSASMLETFNVKEGISSLIAGIDTARGAVASLSPFFEQGINVYKAYFAQLGEGFSQIGGIVSSVFGGISETTGITFQAIGEGVMALMAANEWAWQNIGDVGLLAWQTLQLGGVAFFEEAKHVFTVALPAIFEWATDNWYQMFETMGSYYLSFFSNLHKNIFSVMTEIWDFIASGGTDSMEFAFTPLLDGAVNTLKDLPDIPARAITELEQQLASSVADLSGELGGSLTDHIAKRLETLGPGALKLGGPTLAALPAPAAAQIKTTSASEAPKLAGGFVKGSIEEASLRNKIEAGPEFAKMISQNKEIITELKKANRNSELLLKKPGPAVGST